MFTEIDETQVFPINSGDLFRNIKKDFEIIWNSSKQVYLTINRNASLELIMKNFLSHFMLINVVDYTISEDINSIFVLINLEDSGVKLKYSKENFDIIRITPHLRKLFSTMVILQLNQQFDYRQVHRKFFEVITNPFPFLDFACEPDSKGLTVSRYWIQVWQDRKDLQINFPKPHSLHQGEYLSWIGKYARLEDLSPHEMFEVKRTKCDIHLTSDSKYVYIGYLNSLNGLGEAARENIKMLKALKIVPTTVSYNRINGEVLDSDCKCTSPFGYKPMNKIVFIHINPDNLENFFNDFPQLNKYNNYLIFVWAWEFEEPSDFMRKYANQAHEIWTVSSFVNDSVNRISKNIKSRIFPHFLEMNEIDNTKVRNKYILTCADLNSTSERKNIIGNINCFKDSRLPSEGFELIVKTTNLVEHKEFENQLFSITNQNRTIKLIDGNLDESLMNKLYEEATTYLSLHRSEGFGLNLLKSHRFGTPTIVTNYSGNLDFCNDINSALIDYKLVYIDKKNASYFGHRQWAEPDHFFGVQALNNILRLSDVDAIENSVKILNQFNSRNSFEAGIPLLRSYVKKVNYKFYKFLILNFFINLIFRLVGRLLFIPYRLKKAFSSRLENI